MLLPNLVQVTESISGSVVPLAMFFLGELPLQRCIFSTKIEFFIIANMSGCTHQSWPTRSWATRKLSNKKVHQQTCWPTRSSPTRKLTNKKLSNKEVEQQRSSPTKKFTNKEVHQQEVHQQEVHQQGSWATGSWAIVGELLVGELPVGELLCWWTSLLVNFLLVNFLLVNFLVGELPCWSTSCWWTSLLVNFLLVNIRLVNYILVNFLLVNIGECSKTWFTFDICRKLSKVISSFQVALCPLSMEVGCPKCQTFCTTRTSRDFVTLCHLKVVLLRSTYKRGASKKTLFVWSLSSGIVSNV